MCSHGVAGQEVQSGMEQEIRSQTQTPGCPGAQALCCHLLAVCICKMGLIIVLTSLGCWENEVSIYYSERLGLVLGTKFQLLIWCSKFEAGT